MVAFTGLSSASGARWYDKQAHLMSHSRSFQGNFFFLTDGWFFLRGVAAEQSYQGRIYLTASCSVSFVAHCVAISTTVNFNLSDIWWNTVYAMAGYIHVPDEAPAVPKIDVTVDENDYRPFALRLMKELRPSWKPSEIKMKVAFLSLNALFYLRGYVVLSHAVNYSICEVFATVENWC